ncbi:DUF262 domain-containing protein [Aeromonas hydrophila]|uniref:DUF262 domain-containing protein n=1 Tax=Aeromonas hydrophila TaxID=644 RepID=UPI00366C09B6
MAFITPSTLTVKTCFQSRYSLPYFQRDYKWENRHFLEMLNDIQDAFLLEYDPAHGRRNVSEYKSYFLGSIITSNEIAGKKPLIDGQQRITSLFILLVFFERYIKDNGIEEDAPTLTNYIGSMAYGERDYNVEFSGNRKSIFDAYLKRDTPPESVFETLDDIEGLSDGDVRIIEALRLIQNNLEKTVKDKIEFFIDYFIEKVTLIDISVANEADAHCVFVTMNDRGLRLGAIELLKGYILSKVENAEDSQKSHAAWMETLSSLRKNNSDGDSLFFRDLFRGKWANSIRGKQKGDAAGDFEIIGDAYHRWFEQNVANIGLNTSDDYTKFVTKELPKLSDIYLKIEDAEKKIKYNMKDVYCNGVRKFSFQKMLILSIVNAGDIPAVIEKKIILISKFIDLLLTSRIITNKANTYDNLKDIAFNLVKEIRGKDYAQLLDYLRSEWDKFYIHLDAIPNMSYSYQSRSDTLYVLARIADFIECELNLTNKTGFETYMQRDKGNRTFDIEHIFRARLQGGITSADLGFASDEQYKSERNLIGGLILLPRSRNRSLSDQTYPEKLAAYGTENILCKTLNDGFYKNNPALDKFHKKYSNLKLKNYKDFTKAALQERGELYKEIAKIIWEKP